MAKFKVGADGVARVAVKVSADADPANFTVTAEAEGQEPVASPAVALFESVGTGAGGGSGTAVHRIGDPNTGGGVVASALQTVLHANGILVAVDGSPVTPHGTGVHAGPVTAGGSTVLHANGIPVNARGDADTCGHPRASGSPTLHAVS